MLGYRMDVHLAQEMAAADPFAGRGAFLPARGRDDEILASLRKIFGVIPAVAWPGHGAWVDPAVIGFTAAEAEARWESRRDHADAADPRP